MSLCATVWIIYVFFIISGQKLSYNNENINGIALSFYNAIYLIGKFDDVCDYYYLYY